MLIGEAWGRTSCFRLLRGHLSPDFNTVELNTSHQKKQRVRPFASIFVVLKSYHKSKNEDELVVDYLLKWVQGIKRVIQAL
ncbi:hypothetical protein V7654_05040 [Bacillus sp. JJ1609]|uniref:hypothetical protein n=1 Tax=Bacillus sp. JJ1609 TaxID=3122977 RepID=UPI003000AB4D